MKNLRSLMICLMLLVFLNTGSAQENTIVFSYDKGGRMIQRKVQVFNMGRLSNPFQPKDSVLTPQVNFNIFPNPTNDLLNIEGDLPEHVSEAKVSLINMSGQVLKKDMYTGQSKSMMVSDLKSGMYLLEIKYSKEKKSTYKIVITN